MIAENFKSDQNDNHPRFNCCNKKIDKIPEEKNQKEKDR